MSECTHNWTVTTWCPFCQQNKIDKLRAALRSARDLMVLIAESPSMSSTRGAVLIGEELQNINAALGEQEGT